MRRAWLVAAVAVPTVCMAVAWPSWVAVLWAGVWLVSLFTAAMFWEAM